MSGVNLAVTNALDVLDLLGQAQQPLRLKDIARRLDLPESTTHRLLASLAGRGYVRQSEEHGTYLLGWKIAVLARSLGDGARLVQTMRPYLEDLARRLKQTINLAVLSNDQVMYLDCQTPSYSLALYSAPGATLPAHATALGKTLLAHLPAPERDAILDQMTFTPVTPNTITSRDALLAALEEVRRQGYASDRGELKPDVCCLAAPLLDDRGRALAAISMTAPAAELPADWVERIAPIITDVTREASEKLFGAANEARGERREA